MNHTIKLCSKFHCWSIYFSFLHFTSFKKKQINQSKSRNFYYLSSLSIPTIVGSIFVGKSKAYLLTSFTYSYSFIDFENGFAKVPRRSLIFKLHAMSVSTRIMNLIEDILEEYKLFRFRCEKRCLLKQLFALHFNVPYEHYEGGLNVNSIHI